MTHTYEFGPFRLDTMKRLLTRDGEVVPLRPKHYETLLALVERHGEVVSKKDLMDRIWPDLNVEEGNLTINIHAVRRALGQRQDDHSFIVTVPGVGYKFVVEVRRPRDEGEEFAMAGRATTSNPGEVETPSGAGEGEGVVLPLTSEGANGPTGAGGRRLRELTVALTFVAAIASIALVLYIMWAWSQPLSMTLYREIDLDRLTTTGRVRDAAISPDGQYVIYVSEDDGKQSLRFIQIESRSDREIVPPASTRYHSLTFSPDGAYLYYIAQEGNGSPNALYRIPYLGGDAKKLMTDVGWSITLAPDGQRLAFVRDNIGRGESALIIADANGGGERQLALHKMSNFFRLPAWAPDGRSIACAVYSSDADRRGWHVIALSVADGAKKPITQRVWQRVGRIAWLTDSSGLVLPVTEEGAGSFQVWLLPYPSGVARRITNDLSSYRGVSLSKSSPHMMVTVQTEQTSSIQVALQGNANSATPITKGRYDGREGLAWTPDGQIIYAAKNTDGRSDLWIIKPGGGPPKRLTEGPGVKHWPSLSDDGRYIVFESDRSGALDIWRMDRDGGNLTQLTDTRGNLSPDCAPDGMWVVYHSFASGKPRMWKVPIGGGIPVQIADETATDPVISPNGRQVAYLSMDEGHASRSRLAIRPFEGESNEKVFDLSRDIDLIRPIRWAVDGRALTFIGSRDGISNIYSQPIEGGPPRQLTNSKTERIYSISWSRDGRYLAYASGSEVGDVVVVKNRERK
ncbi:MAG TPA: winged helix-turn-helix domain-containing protein [Blastocatellia bacterium]|nr:winged helix-turn-helix domain-containing protein [Blastocatellia bacterium]